MTAPTNISHQATKCASCGNHKHTPLRIDEMGGYVCLTCIDQKLGSLLGEFGYEAPVRETTAVHLKIEVLDGCACVEWVNPKGNPAGCPDYLAVLLGDDPGAAIRRAIGRAAEEIAKTLTTPTAMTSPPPAGSHTAASSLGPTST